MLVRKYGVKVSPDDPILMIVSVLEAYELYLRHKTDQALSNNQAQITAILGEATTKLNEAVAAALESNRHEFVKGHAYQNLVTSQQFLTEAKNLIAEVNSVKKSFKAQNWLLGIHFSLAAIIIVFSVFTVLR